MDLLPLIQKIDKKRDISATTRRIFQETLDGKIIPPNVKKNIAKSEVDKELSLESVCKSILEIHHRYSREKEQINSYEYNLLQHHGLHLIRKSDIERSCDLKELLKLKRCEIFMIPDGLEYGMIKKIGLYQNILRQFLNFQFNVNIHLCTTCANKKGINEVISRAKPTMTINENRKQMFFNENKESFKVVPSKIFFHNYQTNLKYQVTVKLVNTGCHVQSFGIKTLPRISLFCVDLFNNKEVASGMCVKARISFTPKILKNFKDKVIFRDAKGHTQTVEICCHRDPPLLVFYTLNDLSWPIAKRLPGNIDFDFKRCRALNETIDCGSVLVGDYNFVTILLTNNGENGDFFIITEDEWCHEELINITDSLELKLNNFWIYPAYFTLNKGDTSEIYITFEPTECGLHMENLFLICNNNTYKQLELMADSVCFSRDLLTVDILPDDKDIHKKEKHCIFLRNIHNNVLTTFCITVQNKSCLYLRYYWELTSDDNCLLANWLNIRNDSVPVLAPYSTTDFIFEVEPQVESEGYYKTFISFFVTGIPPLSLKGDSKLKPEIKTIPETTKKLDIMILNSELACYVEIPKLEEIKTSSSEILCECNCCCQTVSEHPKLKFSCSYLDFGILPLGIDVMKKISIKNMSEHKLKWRIKEIRYDIDCRPYMTLVESENVNKTSGVLKAKQETKNVTYKIENKGPICWMSILILFSVENDQITAESICLVTYEIIKYDIGIKAKNTSAPILCPMQLIYPNVPILTQIFVENHSLIPAFFYFLNHFGEDSNKIKIEFHPRSDIIKPRSSKEVNVTLTCLDVGILENIFVPCFIGGGQELIFMRILCAVDNIHLFIFLPIKDKKFQKITWPPKVLFEYDDWNYCVCEHECHAEGADELRLKGMFNENVVDCHDSEISINSSTETDLVKNLEDTDSQLFLQDYIVELRQIDIKKPQKMSLFIENLTPIQTTFNVNSNNFPSNNSELFNKALKTNWKNTDSIWEEMASANGIVIQPQIKSGVLSKFELRNLDIWIYANTWGVYIEEIMIDVGDTLCFCFTLIIEIIGTPIQFPISTPSSLKCPVIRFGSVTYGSQPRNRELLIKNISSIPVHVRWYTFLYPDDTNNSFYDDNTSFTIICDDNVLTKEMNCLLLDNYYGNETTKIKICPRKIRLQEKTSAILEVSIDKELFQNLKPKTEVKCYAVGLILVEEHDGFKSNYFYRRSQKDLDPLVVEIRFMLVEPILSFDIESIETAIVVYANDIILQREECISEILPLRNSSTSAVIARIEAESPLEIYIENKKLENELICVPAQKCLEVTLKCNLNKEIILSWSNVVYHKNPAVRDYVNNDEKIIKMTRLLTISYLNNTKQEIPFDVLVHYPRIMVRPTHLKMDYVLVGCTKKLVVTIYNLTGSVVKFEVYKSCPTEEIVTRPNFGEIGSSVGINKSSAHIFVYFTPKTSQMYQETIRIMTNIPKYFIDIPIKGYGSSNEKFYTDLKL